MIRKTVLLVLFCLLAAPLHAFQGVPMPDVQQQQFGATGLANAAGFVCTYAAGTTTPLATYSDVTLTTNAHNPIQLNAAGRPVAWQTATEIEVFAQARSYKIVVHAAGTGSTCNGTTVGAAISTRDNVNPASVYTVSFNNRQFCTTGADFGAKFTAAAALLPSTGGIVDCSNLQGAQVTTSDVFTGQTKPLTVILPTGTITPAVSFTVPSTMTLQFPQGSVFAVTTGTTATINGHILAADSQQIFSNVGGIDAGLGFVQFGSASVAYVTPQWFGAKQDGSTDDKNPLNAASYSGQTSQAIMAVKLLPSPTCYMTSAAIELPKYASFYSDKSNGSCIKITSGFTGNNLMQNWRAAQGTGDNPPATTSGTGYPSPILFLRNISLNTNNKAVNALTVVHLQEGTIMDGLAITGNTTPVIANANVGDGIRITTNSDTGSNQSWTMRNIVYYGQFRRCFDGASLVSWAIDTFNCTGATSDFLRISSGNSIHLQNIEILVPQSQTDDTVGTAALNIRDVTGFSMTNVLLGAAGNSNFINRDGFLFNDTTGFPDNRNYNLINLRTTYDGAGTTRFRYDVNDNTGTPVFHGADQYYGECSKQKCEGQTGSTAGLLNFGLGWASYGNTIKDGSPQAIAYAAGNFTAAAGTWTVDAGDQLQLSYSVVGKQMMLNFDIATTDVSMATGDLRIALPLSKTIASTRVQTPITCINAGGAEAVCGGFAEVGETFIRLSVGVRGGGGNWTVTAADNTRVTGQITFWTN